MQELEKHGQTTVSESGKRRWVVFCQKQLRMHLRKLNRDVCSSTIGDASKFRHLRD